MGIYKRKQESKKSRKHACDQVSDQEKKERKHACDNESDQEKKTEKNYNGQEKKNENTLLTKKAAKKK